MTDHSTDHWLGRHYAADHIHGPISFLNPTTRLQALHGPTKSSSPSPPQKDVQDTPSTESLPGPDSATSESTGVYSVWRSRDNRKGRHALHITPSRAAAIANTPSSSSKHSNTLSGALTGIGRMFVRWPVWDVSYDVAVIFTLGSVCKNT